MATCSPLFLLRVGQVVHSSGDDVLLQTGAHNAVTLAYALLSGLLAVLIHIVLVLQLYALDWRQFREWPVLPVALPERLLRDLPDTAGLEKVPRVQIS